MVSAATEVPPTASAHALGLAEGATAHHLVRLRHADGVPLAVERGWYHAGRAPGLLELDLTQSIYAQLAETYDVRPDQAWQTVWAEGADRETARLLGMRAGSPLLVFRRVSSANGDPIEDITSWYRGDHYQVTMQLDRNTPEPGQPPHYGGSR